MKTWKLVSGILSIILALICGMQCLVVVIGDALVGGVSWFFGGLVTLLMLSMGIVSIVTQRKKSVAVVVLGLLGLLLGFVGATAGLFADLELWGLWCGICAILGIVALVTGKKATTETTEAGEVPAAKKNKWIAPVVVVLVVLVALIGIGSMGENTASIDGSSASGAEPVETSDTADASEEEPETPQETEEQEETVSVDLFAAEPDAERITYTVEEAPDGLLFTLSNRNEMDAAGEIAVILYDDNGNMVGESTVYFESLPAGATGQFECQFDNQIEYTSYEASLSAEQAFVTNQNDSITIEDSLSEDGIVVKVTNNGEDDVSEVNMACLFYDEEGALVHIGATLVYELEAGKFATETFSRPYNYNSGEEIQYDHYQVILTEAYSYPW